MSENERRNVVELREIAESFGCFLVQAAVNQLLLDIDEGSVPMSVFDDLQRLYGPISRESWPSRGKGEHVLLTLARSLPIAHRIAWQLALGSDPLREVGLLQDISLPELDDGQTNCLFRPKPKA